VRRTGGSLACAGALCLALALSSAPAPVGAARSSGRQRARLLTTLHRTIKAAKGEERRLEFAKGQARVTRTLDWNAPGRGRPLAGFKQVSDIHVIDEESPGRVEYLDACGSPFAAAYRVQEAMSTQVGDSMLERLARITKGPATGVHLDFLVSTGDNIDNNQLNELKWFIRLLDGRGVNPNSGAKSYDGYTRDHYSEALPRRILNEAQKPFEAVGAGIPWYAVVGNHDGLAQGNAPSNPLFESYVTGGTKAFTPIDGYTDCPDDPNDSDAVLDLIEKAINSSAEEVPADSQRSFLDHTELINQHFESSTRPHGHGFADAPQDPMHGSRGGYYSFPIGRRIRGITLDTISYDGVSNGHIPDPQFQWLEEQLLKYSRHYYENGSRQTNSKGRNKLIMVFSHHSSASLDNPGTNPAGAPYHCFTRSDQPGCEDGEGLKELLTRFPNVIAWINGHEHNNRVRPFSAGEGANPGRAFWEINTAAHIDWPQQARLIEVAWKPGGSGRADTVFVYGTTLDHAAPPRPQEDRQSRTAFLASLSRVEAYYDACVRQGQAPCEADGAARDKNVKLVQKAPFDLGD